MSQNNYYILLGGPEHLNFFKHNDRYNRHEWFWTSPKNAKVGEVAFVYLKNPVGRIVGQFQFKAEPFYNTEMFPRWAKNWMAEVHQVVYFEERPELTMKGLRELFPEWAWLSYPRSKVKIPGEILPAFLELVEGVETHVKSYR